MKLHRTMAIGTLIAAGAGLARSMCRSERTERAALGRRVRYLRGCLHGEIYQALGRRPDPDVSDDILADRVRSRLGPISKALDIPHVHVMVNDHVVMLHGDVAEAADALVLADVVAQTAGVRGGVSSLHEGLLRSDTRPSEGARRQQAGAHQVQAA